MKYGIDYTIENPTGNPEHTAVYFNDRSTGMIFRVMVSDLEKILVDVHNRERKLIEDVEKLSKQSTSD